MIAALALIALGDLRATLSVEPRAIEVGEPIAIELTVEHEPELLPTLGEGALELDDSWVVLASESARTRVDADGASAVTRMAWTVASLEPGERELRGFDVIAGDQVRAVAGAQVEVASVLGETEDVARPLKGFREVVDPGSKAPWWPWAIALAVSAAGVASWLTARALGRRRTTPQAARTALAELDEIDRGDLERAEAARAAHFELTRILRSEIDRRAKHDRVGLSDEEWLERALADAGLAPVLAPQRAELESLLRACRDVKYGGASATQWAARERLGQARKILERLAPQETSA